MKKCCALPSTYLLCCQKKLPADASHSYHSEKWSYGTGEHHWLFDVQRRHRAVWFRFPSGSVSQYFLGHSAKWRPSAGPFHVRPEVLQERHRSVSKHIVHLRQTHHRVCSESKPLTHPWKLTAWPPPSLHSIQFNSSLKKSIWEEEYYLCHNFHWGAMHRPFPHCLVHSPCSSFLTGQAPGISEQFQPTALCSL